ncbi:MAG: membrane protein FxsA [Candidatus Dadabacteria bacterium]|nr:membrane protein FxsA [Candidatus Dadabacteria bacterium]
MFARLLILFTVVPLIELALLIKLGNVIGLWPTIFIVIATGVLGAALARSQGTQVISAIRAEVAEGRPPTESLINGLLVLVGGVVLLTPGLLTDLLGFSLLIPFTRNWFKKKLQGRLRKYAQRNSASATIIIR